MLTYLRYALATVCFSTSIGSLALWWRNCLDPDAMALIEICISSTHIFMIKAELGFAVVSIAPRYIDMPVVGWRFWSAKGFSKVARRPDKQLGITRSGNLYFSLGHASLALTLAGVAALRLCRRFSVRSAIIATTVVAALLGMAVGL